MIAWPRRRLRQLGRAGLRVGAEAVALGRRIVAGRRSVDGAEIAALRASIQALAPLPAGQAGGDAMWSVYRARFRQDVVTRDPRRFLRWPSVRPMYRRDPPYIGRWLTYLRARPEWRSRWRDAVRESAVGDPRPFFGYWPSSGNLLYQAYHVCRFEEVTGARLSEADVVVEFGGGYGAFCRLLCALGFRGTYTIFDFPEYSALQRFYLRAHGLPVASRPHAADGRLGIVTVAALDELDRLLSTDAPARRAFVALWSLSESPVSLRDEVMRRVLGFDLFAFGYVGDAVNTAWFGEMRARLGDVDWRELPLLEADAAYRLLFGARRGRTVRDGPAARASPRR